MLRPEVDPDGDGVPDYYDTDKDGDGLDNDVDPNPDNANGDLDGDGIRDSDDSDMDGDGVLDYQDSDWCNASGDGDGDGIPDGSDPDKDGDGIEDTNDLTIDYDGSIDAFGGSGSSDGGSVISEPSEGSSKVFVENLDGLESSGASAVDLLGDIRNGLSQRMDVSGSEIKNAITTYTAQELALLTELGGWVYDGQAYLHDIKVDLAALYSQIHGDASNQDIVNAINNIPPPASGGASNDVSVFVTNDVQVSVTVTNEGLGNITTDDAADVPGLDFSDVSSATFTNGDRFGLMDTGTNLVSECEDHISFVEDWVSGFFRLSLPNSVGQSPSISIPLGTTLFGGGGVTALTVDFSSANVSGIRAFMAGIVYVLAVWTAIAIYKGTF
jgi:hypothetical protein